MENDTPVTSAPDAPHQSCPECGKMHETQNKFCSNCGYPVFGSEDEIRKFKYKKLEREQDKIDLEGKVNSARSSLFVLAGLMGVFGAIMIGLNKEESVALLVQYLVMAGIFLGLGFWSKQKPFAALLTGLIVFISMQLLLMIYDPKSVFSGIIIKVVVIIYIVKGVSSARKVEKMDAEE